MKIDYHKTHLILTVIVGMLSILLIYQVSHQFRIRLDMTEENRYSISDATKDILQQVQEDIYVEVYLEGELPANFLRFKKAIEETLDEFSVYTGSKLEYQFIDPSQAESQRARNQYYQSLIKQGLKPSNLNIKREGKQSQLLVFPGMIISSGGKEKAVNLLNGSRVSSIEEVLNQSIESLEYEIANGIALVTGNQKKKVGLVYGHDEPDSTELAAFTNLVLSKYDLFRINLPKRRTPITGYDLVIISKPATSFSESEKYLLDQYLMRGGKLLYFLDALQVDLADADGEGTIAVPYETNLTDQLFKYGVRINHTYALDLNCGNTPVVSGNIGDQPQVGMLPWPYFPVITNFGNHEAVKGMDAVLLKFASTIDTVKAEGIEKIPLMFTSPHSKILGSPVQVSYNDLQEELLPDKFNAGPQPVGYLLQGKFTSMYKNRFLPAGFDKQDFIADGVDSKVVVIADGDLVRNDFDPETESPLMLGVDPYSKEQYANETLILNLMEYLLDDDGLMQARSKELKIRPLDRAKVKEERLKWQLINLVVPLLILVGFGLLKFFVRKSKYGR